MNMKNEEKDLTNLNNNINIAEYTSTDYTDNDIAITWRFQELAFQQVFQVECKHLCGLCKRKTADKHQYPKICYLPVRY